MDFVACQMVAPRKRDVLDRERLAETRHAKERAKHKGRNHWRNWERRQTALAKRRADEIAGKIKLAADERFRERARAYWLGMRADHP